MAYACARAGWTFVADDATFLLRKRADRYAIGNPHTIRFREMPETCFPNSLITFAAPGRMASSELKPLHAIYQSLLRPDVPLSTLYFSIGMVRGVAQLKPCRQVRAIDWCSRFAEWGDDGARSHQAEAYRRLAECSVWEMEYRDLESGVARLEELTQAAQ